MPATVTDSDLVSEVVEVSLPVDGGVATMRRHIRSTPEYIDRVRRFATERLTRDLESLGRIGRGPLCCEQCQNSYPWPHHSDCPVRRRVGAPVGYENALTPFEAGDRDARPSLRWLNLDGSALPATFHDAEQLRDIALIAAA